MSESKIFFRLTQATNTYKHISRNIGATMKASRKLTHDKVFFNFFTKRPSTFLFKNCNTIKKSFSSTLISMN